MSAAFLVGFLVAGLGFVVLYPILGIALWLSLLVAACLFSFSTVTSRSGASATGPPRSSRR